MCTYAPWREATWPCACWPASRANNSETSDGMRTENKIRAVVVVVVVADVFAEPFDWEEDLACGDDVDCLILVRTPPWTACAAAHGRTYPSWEMEPGESRVVGFVNLLMPLKTNRPLRRHSPFKRKLQKIHEKVSRALKIKPWVPRKLVRRKKNYLQFDSTANGAADPPWFSNDIKRLKSLKTYGTYAMFVGSQI